MATLTERIEAQSDEAARRAEAYRLAINVLRAEAYRREVMRWQRAMAIALLVVVGLLAVGLGVAWAVAR